jgi:hypothetical protein
MKNKKRNKNGFFKDTLIEFIFEVVWNILMFIPRMLIRLIRNRTFGEVGSQNRANEGGCK